MIHRLATRSQTEEDLAPTPLETSLDLDGVVASVKDEQGSGPFLGRAAQKRFHLLSGDLVGLPRGTDPLHVHGGGPALTDEVELGDELVSPSGHDRLAGRMARRMVVEAALGATLRIASGPDAHVHGVDGRCCAPSERMADQQVAQDLRIDTSMGQSRVEASPSAPVRGLEAQVDRRRGGSVSTEDGVGELEEGVASAVEAFVEGVAEAVQSIGRFHDAPIMHSPRASRTP
jgi:hypothetical protein